MLATKLKGSLDSRSSFRRPPNFDVCFLSNGFCLATACPPNQSYVYRAQPWTITKLKSWLKHISQALPPPRKVFFLQGVCLLLSWWCSTQDKVSTALRFCWWSAKADGYSTFAGQAVGGHSGEALPAHVAEGGPGMGAGIPVMHPWEMFHIKLGHLQRQS